MCLRVADLDEAARRWSIQFGLTERERDGGRAYLACAYEPYSLELVEADAPGADHAGFLTARWANAFMDCCEAVLGADVDRAARTVRHEGRTTRIGVHPLGVDGAALLARTAEPDVEAAPAPVAPLTVAERQAQAEAQRAAAAAAKDDTAAPAADTARSTISRNRPVFQGRAEPPPLRVTFGTGQPKLRSM